MPNETALRAILLSALRTVEKLNLVIGTWGNFSIRIDDNSFLITPSGIPYARLKKTDLVPMTVNGDRPANSRIPSTEWRLHAAVYSARPDVCAIAHTHSDSVKSFAMARKPIPASAEDLVQLVGGSIEVAKYALPGSHELGANAVTSLAMKNAVILPNHGLVAVGKTMQTALLVAEAAERNARSVLLSYLIGNPVELTQQDIDTMVSFFRNSYGQKKGGA